MYLKSHIRFRDAKSLIREADVLLFRDRRIFSPFVKLAGRGRYSHCAIASLHGATPECIEFREFRGGRAVSLEEQVRQRSGCIDVYRPTPYNVIYDRNCLDGRTINLQPEVVTNTARELTGRPYSYKSIFWMGLTHLAGFRLCYQANYDDLTKIKGLVCSSMVSYAFRATGYDLVPNLADSYTEPSDISRSALLSYLFTLVK